MRLPRKFNGLAQSRFRENRLAVIREHLGREPGNLEKLLIARTVAMEWKLRIIDNQIRKDLPVEKLRDLLQSANGLETQYRLNLQALGLQPPSPMDERLQVKLSDFLETRDHETDYAAAAP